MLSLIITVILGLLLAVFATQNTAGITMRVGNYIIRDIPLYGIVIGSLLIGLFISWLLSLINGVASLITLRGKDTIIHKNNDVIHRLRQRIHDLEVDNNRLRGRTNEQTTITREKTVDTKPNVFKRIFHPAI